MSEGGTDGRKALSGTEDADGNVRAAVGDLIRFETLHDWKVVGEATGTVTAYVPDSFFEGEVYYAESFCLDAQGRNHRDKHTVYPGEILEVLPAAEDE